MIEVESLLRLGDVLVPIGEVRRYEGHLNYIEGVLLIRVDGVDLIDRRQWDYIDQLWSYLLEGFRVVTEERSIFRCKFPDEPVPVTMQFLKPNRILLRIGERSAVAQLTEFGEAFIAAAEHFCSELARLAGESEVEHLRLQIGQVGRALGALRTSKS